MHQDIANKRLDTIHKVTTDIARTYTLIGVADLHLQGRRKHCHLALTLADAAMGQVWRQLAYKSAWFGSSVQTVGRCFVASTICSAYGYVQSPAGTFGSHLGVYWVGNTASARLERSQA